jgi:hypothetical protein
MFVTVGITIFLLCIPLIPPPRIQYVILETDMDCSYVCSQNSEWLYVTCRRIYFLPKRTKQLLSVYDKMPMVYFLWMPVLHFSSVWAQYQKGRLKNKLHSMHKFAHTNKYSYLLGALWGHGFPITLYCKWEATFALHWA